MTNLRTLTLFSLAVLISFALIAQAKDAAQHQSATASLASKLIPHTKARTSRSLSDMFEKVRSKIFGSKKQAAASNTNAQIQPSASVNVAQRQPWGDLNSINQQYNPYSAFSSSNYQWPAGSQYLGSQYNSINGLVGAQTPTNNYQGIGQANSGTSNMMTGLEGANQVQQTQPGIGQAANTNSGSNGNLLSSASHLIAQYLSPGSGSAAGASAAGSANGQVSAIQPMGQNQMQPNGQGQNLMSPQQQQQQSQYNEFASILDSMVSQTGASPQRQPNGANQYMQPSGSMQPGQQGMQGFQQGAPNGNMMGSAPMVGDNDMSASSNIGSYMPPASAQTASAKSSMVGLAEQLAPGASFNKLVSFPFSLSNNDDPNKEGRYKLHIPFLNQHVKRSDQQQQAGPSASSASQKQYLSYYNQAQQQPMSAQASQAVATVVSPQTSSSSQNVPSASAVNPSSSVSVSQSSSSSSSSSQASPSSSVSASSAQQSSSSSLLSSASNPQVSSSVSGQQNSRPAWSVADLQSSSSKLIPMQSAASSSVEAASPSQS